MTMSEAAKQMIEHEKLIAEWSTERTVYIEAIQRLQTELAAWKETFRTTQLTHAIARQEAIESELNRCHIANAKLQAALADIAKSAFTCPGTPLVCSCSEHKAKRALEFKTADDECASERDVTGMYD